MPTRRKNNTCSKWQVPSANLLWLSLKFCVLTICLYAASVEKCKWFWPLNIIFTVTYTTAKMLQVKFGQQCAVHCSPEHRCVAVVKNIKFFEKSEFCLILGLVLATCDSLFAFIFECCFHRSQHTHATVICPEHTWGTDLVDTPPVNLDLHSFFLTKQRLTSTQAAHWHSLFMLHICKGEAFPFPSLNVGITSWKPTKIVDHQKMLHYTCCSNPFLNKSPVWNFPILEFRNVCFLCVMLCWNWNWKYQQKVTLFFEFSAPSIQVIPK